jgi:hypothetical protein
MDGKSGLDRGLGFRELEHHPVAEALDQPAAVSREYFVRHLVHELPPPAYDVILVLLDQPDGLDHVHDEHRPQDLLRRAV